MAVLAPSLWAELALGFSIIPQAFAQPSGSRVTEGVLPEAGMLKGTTVVP